MALRYVTVRTSTSGFEDDDMFARIGEEQATQRGAHSK